MSQYKIFGVKNDELITKLLEILEYSEIDFEFVDFRDCPPTDEQLLKWGEFEGIEFPINPRNSLFKRNKKKFSVLTNTKKADWIRENYHVILRPIIENESEEILSIGGRPERISKSIFGLVPIR
jgi:arsenate reductase (glutaredoxin)